MLPFRGALAVALTALLGCSFQVPERPVTPALTPVRTPPRAEEAPPAARGGPRAFAHPAPAMVFESVEGAEAARVHAALAPVSERLAECRPGTTGVIRLRLVKSQSGHHYTVEPSTTLDPRQRTCVLEALSTADVDAISLDTNPGRPGLGFTAHFRFEW